MRRSSERRSVEVVWGQGDWAPSGRRVLRWGLGSGEFGVVAGRWRWRWACGSAGAWLDGRGWDEFAWAEFKPCLFDAGSLVGILEVLCSRIEEELCMMGNQDLFPRGSDGACWLARNSELAVHVLVAWSRCADPFDCRACSMFKRRLTSVTTTLTPPAIRFNPD